jgi:hypothetical protein
MYMILLILSIMSVSGLINSDISTEAYQRIAVIPDAHGDVDASIRSLWVVYNEINASDLSYELLRDLFRDYILFRNMPNSPLDGRRLDVAVIQLGDMVDRGPDSMDCILLFKAIPAILGWRVYNLIGNHEVSAYTGQESDLIHEEDLVQFGGLQKRAKEIHRMTVLRSLGFLRVSSPVASQDFHTNPNTLFVHGGIEPDWIERFILEKDIKSGSDVNEMNRAITKSLVLNLPDAIDMLQSENSIVWDRTLATAPEESICGEYLDRILHQFNVARIVVGHTPQADLMVKTRCNGKIILADSMMSRWMLNDHVGRPTAVVFSMNPATCHLDSIDVLHTDLDGLSLERFSILQS